MTLIYADPKAEIRLTPDVLFNASSLRDQRPSFEERIKVTPKSFKEAFFKAGYGYLVDSAIRGNLPLFLTIHPQTTYSCADKTQMLNSGNCATDLLTCPQGLDPSRRWNIDDTVKAVYFLDKATQQLLICVIPGREQKARIAYSSFGANEGSNPYASGTPNEAYSLLGAAEHQGWAVRYDDGRLNAKATLSHAREKRIEATDQKSLIMNSKSQIKKNIRPFPVGESPLFGFGVEGSLSPLPPEFYFSASQRIDTLDELGGIYIDKELLAGNPDRLVDLSISPEIIQFPEGKTLEQRIIPSALDPSNSERLYQVIGAKPTEVVLNEEGAADIFGPIIRGDYRESTTSPKKGDPFITLSHHVLPPHRVSVLMRPNDISDILSAHFPGRIHSILMEYEVQQ